MITNLRHFFNRTIRGKPLSRNAGWKSGNVHCRLIRRHAVRITTRGHIAVDCQTRTSGGHWATPTGVLVGPRLRCGVQYDVRPIVVQLAVRSAEQKEDALLLDSNYYGSSLHGIRIGKRQVEDESGNQPLPEDHNHGNAALVRGTSTCVRSASTGSVGRFGIESLRLQMKLRAVRARPGDGDSIRRNFCSRWWNWSKGKKLDGDASSEMHDTA